MHNFFAGQWCSWSLKSDGIDLSTEAHRRSQYKQRGQKWFNHTSNTTWGRRNLESITVTLFIRGDWRNSEENLYFTCTTFSRIRNAGWILVLQRMVVWSWQRQWQLLHLFRDTLPGELYNLRDAAHLDDSRSSAPQADDFSEHRNTVSHRNSKWTAYIKYWRHQYQ